MDTTELPLAVGVDGSEPSLRAVDRAADEAALRGVPPHAVYACLWERHEGAALARDIGKPSAPALPQEVTGGATRRARARRPELKVSSEVVFEEPEYALVRAGRQASALVVGTSGHGGIADLLLGSVSLAVAAHTGHRERKNETEIAVSMTRQIDGVVTVIDKPTYRLDDSRLQPDRQAPHGVADDWLRRI